MLALGMSVLREVPESGRDRSSCSLLVVLHLNGLSIKLSSRVTRRVRFQQPYIYTMEALSLAGQQLTVQQKPFSHEGFASTGAAHPPKTLEHPVSLAWGTGQIHKTADFASQQCPFSNRCTFTCDAMWLPRQQASQQSKGLFSRLMP